MVFRYPFRVSGHYPIVVLCFGSATPSLIGGYSKVSVVVERHGYGCGVRLNPAHALELRFQAYGVNLGWLPMVCLTTDRDFVLAIPPVRP